MLFEPNTNVLPLVFKPIFKELPFIEGEIYDTKFQTKEKFKIEKITYVTRKVIDEKGNSIKEKVLHMFWGYYVGREGLYPLGGDRLIARKELAINQQTCPHCHSYVK